MNKNIIILSLGAALAMLLPSCEIDDRIDDLTGGYHGAFIDKNTGDTVYTEYYGAKLKLLDIEYGSAAQPLVYNTLPDGTFQNTKVFPSKYKVWADGPFYALDTIYGDIRKFKEMNLKVVPNVKLQITDLVIRQGIIADVTYSYQVNDIGSQSQQVGIVYGTTRYPGQLNAMDESVSNAYTWKRVKSVSDLEGEFTETFYLSPNKTYYFRALGQTASAGDYWNYSNQIVVNSGTIDISDIPIEAKQGATSSTSSILQWSFPPIVDSVKISYTDKDGANVVDVFDINDYSYVANLPQGSVTSIKVNLIAAETTGPDQKIDITTKALSEPYIPDDKVRPANIPFFHDLNMKYSLSMNYANMKAAERDPAWLDNPLNHEYFDWWNGWLNNPAYLPTCGDMELFTELRLAGGIQTLVDILPCINLKKLRIEEGSQFSAGETISTNVDLKVLTKLKQLETISLSPAIQLTEDMFRKAGIPASVEVIVE